MATAPRPATAKTPTDWLLLEAALGAVVGETVGAITVGVTVVAEGLIVVTETVAVPVVGKMGLTVREPVSVEAGAVPVAVAVPVAEPEGETPELVAVPAYGVYEKMGQNDGSGGVSEVSDVPFYDAIEHKHGHTRAE